jgi:hypothetical protein
MGQFGCITNVSELPKDRVLVGYVREAARLNETGKKVGPIRKARKPLPVPKELVAALKKKAGANARFKALTPSQQREYSEWIVEAKREETREKRLRTAVDQIAEGKPLMWKYMRKPAKKPREFRGYPTSLSRGRSPKSGLRARLPRPHDVDDPYSASSPPGSPMEGWSARIAVTRVAARRQPDGVFFSAARSRSAGAASMAAMTKNAIR